MRHSPNKAFTLVELLVVISIIGMLMSLLLPAVQSAREAGRANTCRNNLKNLALAMRNFDSSQNRLPGFINAVGLDPEEIQNERRLRASWFVMLLPYAENEQIWESWNQKHIPVVSSISLADCPSDPSEYVGEPTLSYVVNTGQWYEHNGDNDPYSPDAVAAHLNRAGNGLFFDNCSLRPDEYPAVGGREIKMSLTYVESNDGATNTLMMTESLHTLFWADDNAGFPESGTKAAPAAEEANGGLPDLQQLYGFFWHNDSSSNPTLTLQIDGQVERTDRINGAKRAQSPDMMSNLVAGYGYPSSNHPGSVQAAFCDGRVQTLRESIDARVYRQLMTTKRKASNVLDIEKDFIVDSSDL